MPTTLDPRQYILGAADVYYRAVGVLTPWTSIGATLDDAVATITATRFTPDNLNGVMGPVQGLDYLRKVEAMVEFTMPEIAGTKLGLVIPGTRITTATGANSGSSPFTSTLSAATVMGAKTIAVVAVTNLTVGDSIKIDTGTLAEYRVVTDVTSLVVGFRDPLIQPHASGVAAVETVDDNRSQFQSPLNRRIPDSEYREWALVASNGNGYQELRLPRAVSTTETAAITFGEQTVGSIKVTLSARYTGTDLTLSPFTLFGPN